MKITVGKLSIEKNGIECKWDGMSIEGTVEETVESYKYMYRMMPELKAMLMQSVEEVKACQAEEARMRRESHCMDMELENARFKHAKILANMANESANVFKVDRIGIGDDEGENLSATERAYKETRGLKFEKHKPHEETEKRPDKKAKHISIK